MSSGAAYFIAYDDHHPDSPAAEEQSERRSSLHKLEEKLNPFHHHTHSPSKLNKEANVEGETAEARKSVDENGERRRSSVANFVRKIVHGGEHEGDYKKSVEEGERGRTAGRERGKDGEAEVKDEGVGVMLAGRT